MYVSSHFTHFLGFGFWSGTDFGHGKLQSPLLSGERFDAPLHLSVSGPVQRSRVLGDPLLPPPIPPSEETENGVKKVSESRRRGTTSCSTLIQNHILTQLFWHQASPRCPLNSCLAVKVNGGASRPCQEHLSGVLTVISSYREKAFTNNVCH